MMCVVMCDVVVIVIEMCGCKCGHVCIIVVCLGMCCMWCCHVYGCALYMVVGGLMGVIVWNVLCGCDAVHVNTLCGGVVTCVWLCALLCVVVVVCPSVCVCVACL